MPTARRRSRCRSTTRSPAFRLVAIADAEVQKFGTGSTSIRVTQDLQVLAGLPPLVRDGDQFSAMLTLRNTTPREMKVRGDAAGHGQPAGGRRRHRAARVPIALPPQDVVLAAGGGEGSGLAGQRAGRGDQHRLGGRGRGEGSAKDRLKLDPARRRGGAGAGAAGDAGAARGQLHLARRRAGRCLARRCAARRASAAALIVARAAEAERRLARACAASSRPIPSPASSRRPPRRSA